MLAMEVVVQGGGKPATPGGVLHARQETLDESYDEGVQVTPGEVSGTSPGILASSRQATRVAALGTVTWDEKRSAIQGRAKPSPETEIAPSRV